VTVANSSVSGNTGHGIYNGGGTLIVTNCTISDNSSPSRAGFGGAGIASEGFSGAFATLVIIGTTINHNIDHGDSNVAGGISAYTTAMTVTNSTVSGNSSLAGGGISLNGGNLTLTNSTVSGNAVSGGGGGVVWGGEFMLIRNTIIAGNTAAIFPDVFVGGLLS